MAEHAADVAASPDTNVLHPMLLEEVTTIRMLDMPSHINHAVGTENRGRGPSSGPSPAASSSGDSDSGRANHVPDMIVNWMCDEIQLKYLCSTKADPANKTSAHTASPKPKRKSKLQTTKSTVSTVNDLIGEVRPPMH